MKRRKENGKIYLSFPYNKDFSTKLKHHCGAKWNAETREWYFDEEFEDESNNLLLDWFGFSYRSTKTIKVEFRAWDFYSNSDGKISLNNVNLVWFDSVRRGIVLRDGVIIKRGEFTDINYRAACIKFKEENDIVLMATISKEFYDTLSDEQRSRMTIVDDDTEAVKRIKLMIRKEQLLEELAEIEKELADLGTEE